MLEIKNEKQGNISRTSENISKLKRRYKNIGSAAIATGPRYVR